MLQLYLLLERILRLAVTRSFTDIADHDYRLPPENQVVPCTGRYPSNNPLAAQNGNDTEVSQDFQDLANRKTQ